MSIKNVTEKSVWRSLNWALNGFVNRYYRIIAASTLKAALLKPLWLSYGLTVFGREKANYKNLRWDLTECLSHCHSL